VTEKKRIRIVSNGRAGHRGRHAVFIDGVDVTNTVKHVTWSIGANFPKNMSVATVTFTGVELDVEYMAEEIEPNERVHKAGRLLPGVVRREET